MNLESVRAIHIYVFRNNKSITLYTTLDYSNIKSYKLQLYDALFFTFQFSLFKNIQSGPKVGTQYIVYTIV